RSVRPVAQEHSDPRRHRDVAGHRRGALMDPYLSVKWLHILSSTVLFGTGLGTALQMVLAHRARDARVIAGVARNVVRADWLCTLPSGIIQPLSGALLIAWGGFDPWAPWLVIAYAFYLIAAACWVRVVILQLRLRDLATQ